MVISLNSIGCKPTRSNFAKKVDECIIMCHKVYGTRIHEIEGDMCICESQ